VKLLADENLDSRIVTWLRDLGHDVVWAAASLRGADDHHLCEQAVIEGRVVVTRDRDFGRLVFGLLVPVPGVLLVRVTAATAEGRLKVFQRIWPAASDAVDGHFVTATSRGLRLRPLPT